MREVGDVPKHDVFFFNVLCVVEAEMTAHTAEGSRSKRPWHTFLRVMIEPRGDVLGGEEVERTVVVSWKNPDAMAGGIVAHEPPTGGGRIFHRVQLLGVLVPAWPPTFARAVAVKDEDLIGAGAVDIE